MEQRLVYDGTVRVWEHRAGSWAMARPHRHDDLEANLCLCGRAAYLLDGRRVVLEPGALLFLHRGEEHILIDESRDFRMWIVVWRPAAVRARLAEGIDPAAATARPATTELRRLMPATLPPLANLCAEVARADGPARDHGGAFLLWRLRSAFQAGADRALETVHPAVVLAARLLREDPGRPLRVVARSVGLSPDRLGRLFRAAAGTTLVDYRTRVRLERVCAIWRPGCDLLRLAFDAGFGSYSAFHRAFLYRFGRPPASGLAEGTAWNEDTGVGTTKGGRRRGPSQDQNRG